MRLTIAYVTFRREPMIDWFYRSLERECHGDYTDIDILVVDGQCQTTTRDTRMKVPGRPRTVPPKPCVWNGPHRLTKNEYFAAASVRNTAICYADDGYIAFVDDLSFLTEGWLKAVRDAMKGNYVACGAYRKVLNLKMRDDGSVSFDNFPQGWDHRWATGSAGPIPTHSNWHYGCSIAGPIDAYLQVNGFPEMCDSMGLGMEDQMTGMALANTGHKLMYDRRMLTIESEERHHSQTKYLRVDKKPGGAPIEIQPGVTHPNEKGHFLVHRLKDAKRFDNDFTPFPDLAALRSHILSGGEFPIMKTPNKDWFDGQPLSEL